jgi:flagellar basal body P-ring protein FlgI
MLNDTLQALYTAMQNNDTKQSNDLIKGLNKIGVDNYTINILIKELIAEGIIK